ncbi:MAG: hypothetical protein WBC90_01100 [Albidovulum sp.]
MPNPRLLAVVTAMMFLLGGNALRAELSLSQLQELERIISSNDTGALRSYLDQHPDLLSGNDPLSRELREFCGGGLSCFNKPAPASAPPARADTSSASRIY